MRVSTTAGATRGDDDALPVMREVGDIEQDLLRLGVELAHDGAHRNLENQVLAVFAVAAGALAVRAALCAEIDA